MPSEPEYWDTSDITKYSPARANQTKSQVYMVKSLKFIHFGTRTIMFIVKMMDLLTHTRVKNRSVVLFH